MKAYLYDVYELDRSKGFYQPSKRGLFLTGMRYVVYTELYPHGATLAYGNTRKGVIRKAKRELVKLRRAKKVVLAEVVEL